jgi:phosphoenolpyruvate-protein kinase (PTS system EI component)
MCEVPSNVILADKFLEVLDGYSIGSNDLTQLVLGVDRFAHYYHQIALTTYFVTSMKKFRGSEQNIR